MNRSLIVSLGLLVACSSSPTTSGPAPANRAPSADEISNSDDPSRLLPGASRVLSDNITADDVGKTFGVTDDNIPYPDTYWPFTSEGIDAKWNGDTNASPLEKFMGLFDTSDTQAAKDWEHNNHGNGVPGVAGWWGHCPGWTGAAMLNAPLKHSINVKSDGNGGVAACGDGDTGCTTFEIGDINALMAEIHVDAESRFIGNRCDTKVSDIQRDQYGRIVRNGRGCQGLNPGSLMIVLGTQMKANQRAMAIDAQNDFNTDQIWNQPAYRYQVYRYQTLSAADATKLVANGQTPPDSYIWNTDAQGFALVDIGIKWVSEHGPNTTPFSGVDSTRETRMVAVLELDGDPTAAGTKIIGGEYLDDSTAGADRLTAPPFVWIATAAGPEQPWASGASGHNPYVKPSLVAQLVQLAQQ